MELPGVSTNSVQHRTLPSGFHIVANLVSPSIDRMMVAGPFRDFIHRVIDAVPLARVGEAFHDFPGGGFTGVICLSESHLSIHTWPAEGYITFDIFLSNFTQDNSPAARTIYVQVKDFFSAEILFEEAISR